MFSNPQYSYHKILTSAIYSIPITNSPIFIDQSSDKSGFEKLLSAAPKERTPTSGQCKGGGIPFGGGIRIHSPFQLLPETLHLENGT